MASFTSFLNLLKKNPATDGKDTFNIETMLNENWDKIDLKVEENSSAIGQKADKTQISNPNLLINGDFQVWQRGVSFGIIPTNSYTADRWNNSGGSSLTEKTISGIKHITPSNSSGLLQIIEDFDGKLSNKVVTLSVLMKANTQIRLEVNGVSSNPLNCSDYTLLKFTTNIGTILNGKLPIRIRNAEFGVSTFEIKYVKLELGDIATPFSPRPYAEELAMCQRYYEVLERVSGGRFNLLCAAVSTTEARTVWSFKVSKRTYGNLQLSGSFREVPSGQSVTLALYEQDNNTLTLKVTGLTFAVGHSCVIQPNDAGGSLILDAEIY